MIFYDYFNVWPKAKCDKIFGQWRKWVLTQLTLFYLWFYKVQFCNFRRLITWRSQLGPPIQVLYRVTLFIRKYKSLSRREAAKRDKRFFRKNLHQNFNIKFCLWFVSAIPYNVYSYGYIWSKNKAKKSEID